MAGFTKEEYYKEENATFPEDKPDFCFFCGRGLFDDPELSTGGVINWIGANTEISLHQPCAEHLGIHLIQDARSVVRKVKRICKIKHREPQDGSQHWHAKGE